jgi:hypothetical protein
LAAGSTAVERDNPPAVVVGSRPVVGDSRPVAGAHTVWAVAAGRAVEDNPAAWSREQP